MGESMIRVHAGVALALCVAVRAPVMSWVTRAESPPPVVRLVWASAVVLALDVALWVWVLPLAYTRSLAFMLSTALIFVALDGFNFTLAAGLKRWELGMLASLLGNGALVGAVLGLERGLGWVIVRL